MLGWKRDELVGKMCSDIFQATDTNGIIVCGSSCIGQRILWGENVAGEVHRLSLMTKEGMRMLCDIRGSAVRDSKGNVKEIIYALIRAKPSVTPMSMGESSLIEGMDELKEIVLGSK